LPGVVLVLAAGAVGDVSEVTGGATGASVERFKYKAATTAMTRTSPIIKKGRARFMFVSQEEKY
jgi:hypothetical protein